MRVQLICILLLPICMAVSARVNAQRINIKAKGVSLEYLLLQIKEQSGYTLFYELRDIAAAHKADVDIKNADVETALNICFKSQPLGYRIINNTIAVFRKTGQQIPSELQSVSQVQDLITITGKVTDKNGTPLPGVTVRIRDTNIGTLTDAYGYYTVKAKNDGVITFSFVGFNSVALKIDNQTTIDISMVEEENVLEETIVKGYYTTTKASNTGNVSVVSSGDLSRQPVSDPLAALQGQVPGLFVEQGSGAPGREFTIRLRGRNSIANGNDPLYIIDGVPFNSTPINSRNYVPGSETLTSPLNDISISDIESISVLKDADATAIYGSRGANGVILITTKKGRSGGTNFSITSYGGVGTAPRMDLLNTHEYISMRREAFENDNAVPGPTDYDLNGVWDATRSTDWQKVMIGRRAGLYDIQAALSGGSDQTQFRLSGGYRNETMVYPGNNYNRKGNGLVTISHRSKSNRAKIIFSSTYVLNNSQLPTVDMTKYILLSPNAPALFTDDGTLNWENNTWVNPFQDILKKYTEQSDNLLSNINATFEIVKGLNLKISGGYNTNSLRQTRLTPLSSIRPDLPNPQSRRGIILTRSSIKSWILEPQISYAFDLKDVGLDFLVGTTLQETKNELLTESASGFNNDAQIENISAATTKNIVEFQPVQYKYAATYGKVGINLFTRYYLNLTGRRDGSSRFGPRRRFGNFGAIGVAWLFAKERWISENLSLLSSGKIRGSIGVAGNDKMQDYKFFSTYSSTPTTYQGISGLSPTQLTNPYYSWEKVTKIEGGLELGFLRDRFWANLSLYRHRTGNQLVGYSLPDITGFNNVAANMPAIVQNHGTEVEVGGKVLAKGAVSWEMNFNLSIQKNKLVSYPNIEKTSYATQFAVGEPLFITYRYHYLGIDHQTGLYQFEDVDRNGSITASADRQFFFNGQDFFGGWNNSISVGSFQLEFLFSFAKQQGFNFLFDIMPGALFENGGNQPKSVLSRENIQPFSQKFSGPIFSNSRLFDNSSGRFTDASYVRLKNVSLSYSFPQKMIDKLHLKSSRLFLHGQNLLTITKYKGLDPETRSGLRLPPLRMFTGGVQVAF